MSLSSPAAEPNRSLFSAVDESGWTRRVLVTLAVLLTWRVGYLAIMPLELCPDEAYYWDWSRQLDYGYFSKPPMIAWLMALSTRLVGSSEFVIRLPAAILSTLGLWAVYQLGRGHCGPCTGFWAMLAVAATPGMTAMGLLMTIDAPFLCCWAFAVWCVGELLRGDTVRWQWWWPAVLATGCGLLSKQTMLAIYPCILLWLVTDSAGRRQLRSPAVWSWLAASLVFLTPVVWWNWQHDWVTVLHTQEHFQSRVVPWTQHVVWFFEFWAGQIGVVSPVTWLLSTIVVLSGLVTWPHQSRAVRFLLCLSVVPMLGVTLLSGWQRLQPNWPAAFSLTAIVLAAGWATGELPLSIPQAVAVNRVWFFRGVACSGVLSVAVCTAVMIVPYSSWAGSAWDATVRLRGWRELARDVDRVRSEAFGDEPHLVVALTGRGPVSELAYYLHDRPRVYRYNATGIVESQHEVWGGPQSGSISSAILIAHAGTKIPQELMDSFDRVVPMNTVTTDLGSGRRLSYELSHASGFRGWPRSQKRNTPERPYQPPSPLAFRPTDAVENAR